jgi:hypothetical protein
MKKVLTVLFVFMAVFGAEARDRIDEYPGLFEIKVGNRFSAVKHMFGSVKEKDVKTGKEYYFLLNPEGSEYSEILDAKIDKLLVHVVNGTIEEVIVIYPQKTMISSITAAAKGYYGPAPCINESVKEEVGCLWKGDEYALEVSNDGKTYIRATFRRVVR